MQALGRNKMYKLIIVDDEPLIQVGIKSMVNWQELNIEVCATAVNGRVALDLIEQMSPDIVITDIKMPVMDGLELMKQAEKLYGINKPVFIILTSYEDFGLAREAIRYQALDYLVKLELTPDSLREVMIKATKQLDSKASGSAITPISAGNLHSYKEKFLISLLNNLFESEEQMTLQASALKIDLESSNYLCCYGSFETDNREIHSSDKVMALYSASLQMFGELIEKYYPSFCLSLDISHFALILRIPTGLEYSASDYRKICDILTKIRLSLNNYYNVILRCGVGYVVNTPLGICESYQYSRLSYRKTTAENPIYYMESDSNMPHDAFHFSLFRKELIQAFEEYNSASFRSTIDSITDLLCTHPHHYVQAFDAASNILYLAISLLPEGSDTLSGFFTDEPDGYMSLYRKTGVDQVVAWLKRLSDSICSFFDAQKIGYKNRIVADVKSYLTEHIREKLSLNETAAKFGISPAYLSQLFAKYNSTGFSEYINTLKVDVAKQMLREGNAKVYEVADALSFGSEFYFSKVFKKIEGISPSEYIAMISSR